jgi:hypothetical protein
MSDMVLLVLKESHVVVGAVTRNDSGPPPPMEDLIGPRFNLRLSTTSTFTFPRDKLEVVVIDGPAPDPVLRGRVVDPVARSFVDAPRVMTARVSNNGEITVTSPSSEVFVIDSAGKQVPIPPAPTPDPRTFKEPGLTPPFILFATGYKPVFLAKP